jgi:CRP/FNR family transcriptional regulator
MLAEEAYKAEGVAETDVTVVVLPKSAFDRLSAEEDAFRNFVFAAYSRRLIDLLRVVDDVAFGRVDVRLAERLLTLGQGCKEVRATHQELASELGTAREVVSRVLHDFQKRELIEQSRGLITFKDKQQLAAIAASV